MKNLRNRDPQDGNQEIEEEEKDTNVRHHFQEDKTEDEREYLIQVHYLNDLQT